MEDFSQVNLVTLEKCRSDIRHLAGKVVQSTKSPTVTRKVNSVWWRTMAFERFNPKRHRFDIDGVLREIGFGVIEAQERQRKFHTRVWRKPLAVRMKLFENQKSEFEMTYELFVEHCIQSWDRVVRMMDAFEMYFAVAKVSKSSVLPGISWEENFGVMTDWFYLSFHGQLEKYLKYHTCVLQAASFQNDLPEPPTVLLMDTPGSFLGKTRNRQLRFRAFKKKPNDILMGFFHGLCQVKRASLEISSALIKESVKSTFLELTSSPVEVEDDYLRELVTAKVRSTVTELCRRQKRSRLAERVPSNRACIEKTRGKGGNFRAGEDHWREVDGLKLDGMPYAYLRLTTYLVRMYRYGSRVVEERSAGNPWMEQDLTELSRVSPWRHVPFLMNGLHKKVSPAPVLECPSRCKLVGLPEPFKVRVISKGSFLPYNLAKRYQPWLHGALQQSRVFELTGGPLSEASIARLVKGNLFPFHSDTSFLNGDYKGATNLLDAGYSEVALETFLSCWNVPWEERVKLLSLLTRHMIENPEIPDSYEAQMRGQLMGSFLSFPILCIINYAINTVLLEELVSDWMRKPFHIPLPSADADKVHILINGDDVCMILPQGSYRHWKKIVTLAGLVPSVGKNFISRRYALINSQLFSVSEGWEREPDSAIICRVPSVKSYLAYNTSYSRRLTEEGNAVVTPIDDRLRTMVNSCPEEGGEREFLMTAAIRRHREELMEYPKSVSWFAPRAVGGLGLPWTREGSISPAHLRVCAYVACLDDERRFNLIRGIDRAVYPKELHREEAQDEEIRVKKALKLPLERVTYSPAYTSRDVKLLSPWSFAGYGARHSNIEGKKQLSFGRWDTLCKNLFKKSLPCSLTPMLERHAADLSPVAYEYNVMALDERKVHLAEWEAVQPIEGWELLSTYWEYHTRKVFRSEKALLDRVPTDGIGLSL